MVIRYEFLQKYQKWMEDKKISANLFIDGIMDENTFNQPGNQFKPLFLLHEVHDTSVGRNIVYDLRSPSMDIRNGTSQMWKRLAALAYGLYQAHHNIPWEYDYNLFLEPPNSTQNSNVYYQEIIDRIAIMNIKKIGGGAYSNSKRSHNTRVYSKHLYLFSHDLRQQIMEINPTIIVCCGAGDKNLYGQVLFQPDSDIPGYSYYYDNSSNSILANGCRVIEVYHPSMGSRRKKNYEAAFEWYRAQIH